MYQPATYDYIPLERVIYGQPAAEAVVSEAARLKGERVLIVTSKSVAVTKTVGANYGGAWKTPRGDI